MSVEEVLHLTLTLETSRITKLHWWLEWHSIL